nr:MAG TPA: tail tape measure [Caudoviricetes sp.]
MATVIDSFMITLGLDPTDFNKGIDEASKKTESFASKLIKKGTAAATAFFSFGGIIAQVKGLAAGADGIGKIADRIGANASDLYAWGTAAELSGGSVRGLFDSVEGLNKQLTRIAVTGKSRILPFFEQLGVAVVDDSGKVRNVFDVLRDLAGAVEGMSKLESQGILSSLQLDEGTIGLLQGGRQALDDLIKRQKDLGYFTKEDTVIAAKFNDSITELSRSFRFVFLPILRFAAPTLTQFALALTDAFAYMQKHGDILTMALYAIVAVVTGLLLPALWSLFTAILANPITWVIMLIAAFLLVLEDLWVYANGGKSAFEDLWEMLGTGDEVLATLQTAWDYLKQAAQIAWEILKQILLFALMGFYKIVTAMALLVTAGGAAFKAIAGFINDYLISPLESAWEWIGKILDKIPSLSSIKATISERWEQANTPIPSLQAIAAGGGGSNTNQEINVGKIDIHTAATDASGIAADMGGAISEKSGLFFTNASGIK